MTGYLIVGGICLGIGVLIGVVVMAILAVAGEEE